MQSRTHPAVQSSVAGEQRWQSPAVSIRRQSRPRLSHQSQSSGRFDTRKWSGQISRLSPVTVGILRFLYTDSSLEDRQSILQMAVRIPPFSKKGIRYRRMDVFPTADDPENKNTCFGITTPLSVLAGQHVSQCVKSIAEGGDFRQYQMRLSTVYFGTCKRKTAVISFELDIANR